MCLVLRSLCAGSCGRLEVALEAGSGTVGLGFIVVFGVYGSAYVLLDEFADAGAADALCGDVGSRGGCEDQG